MTKSRPPGNKVIFGEFDHFMVILQVYFPLKFVTYLLAAIMSHENDGELCTL